MSTNSPNKWPEAFVSDTKMSRTVNREVRAGRLRKLGSRLYTPNLMETPEAIVRHNLWQIVAGYFPGALIADRTALENTPAADGSICLITQKGNDIALPGIVLRPRRGPEPQAQDRPFIAGLHLSSIARAYLENMRPSRRARNGSLPRTLSRRELEERLESLLRRSGIEALNNLRDQIKAIAPTLGLVAEGESLSTLIGALQGTRESDLISPIARARRAGAPYDPGRIELFHILHKSLRNHLAVPCKPPPRDQRSTATLSFFEAYFSNFIEGTEFEVNEAANIIFQGHIPVGRPADAHDILGTWRIVSDPNDMGQAPASFAAFLVLLRRRHEMIMAGRPEKVPGSFKSVPNRAGQTVFVAPELLEGTLAEGFALYRSLETAFQRAVFMMFMVSEAHPFTDGNGRVARIMMNAALIANGEERIIVPTVYRGNYLAALKALSLTANPEPLIRALDYAQRWTHSVPWGDLQTTQHALETCHAFLDPTSAEAQGIRLQMLPHLKYDEIN